MSHRNRLLFIILLVFSLLTAVGISLASMPVFANATPAEEDQRKIILIDPGHGGIDGGAASRKGTVEKDLNLKISLKLRDKLKEEGYVVLLTREEDKGLYNNTESVQKMKLEDLNNRCKIKRDSNCDVFISIHQNHFPQIKYYGAQVWYSRSDNSQRLGHIIQRNLRNDLSNGNQREEKCSGNDYKILRCYLNIPSVIVECGFLSNPREEVQLKDDNYQDIIAESLAKSINEYFKVLN
jgi:N-acetylmuramoyl-L-alanine amidase